MDEADRNSLSFPLLILDKIFMFSLAKNPKRILIARVLYITSLSFILISAFMQFLIFKGDVFEIVGNLEGLSAFGQHLGKVSVITYKTADLSRLIRSVSNFWKTNKCPKTEQLRLDKLLKNNLSLQKLFFVCIGVSAIVSVLSPFFGRALPLGVWNLEGYDLLYKATLVAQSVTLPPMGMFLVAFDCIFLAFCIEVIVQFRILCECFQKLEAESCGMDKEEFHKKQYDSMRTYVQHHVFMLKFLKRLQDIYSPAVVVEYVTITPVICAEMYALFESNDFGLLSRYGVICITSILQLAFYCIPADYAASEALVIADAVFSSDWYSNCNLRKSVPFIMQKAQKPFLFTAGGLFEINSRTLLTVVKISWSSCTVMRAIKQKP